MSTPADHQVECVGSLLVPSRDVQELSLENRTTSECVGSLLVDSKDIQELGSSPMMASSFTQVNLQKRVTVGTLLVPPDDLKTTHEESSSPSLARRVTERLQGPPPDDADTDMWAD